MADHPVPQDRSPLDDAERRDFAEKVGYGSATTPPGDLTAAPTRQPLSRVGTKSQLSQERSGYWPSTWRDGDEPYRHYWRVLYPEYADLDSRAHWYAKWKTSEMAMGLFGERQRVRHEWIASGPRRGRQEAHAIAVVTYHASPVRSRTVKVCLVCLWVSADLDAEHG
jgi:hypothetical protein